MASGVLVSVASKSSLITHTGFKNYDVCLNPYVGCEFGCSYCYVRFFVKDKEREWGDFVRVRSFLEDKLPSLISKGFFDIPAGKIRSVGDDGETKVKKIFRPLPVSEARLVIGTMTDPYQPQEKKHRITRRALEILNRPDLPRFKKVGIFTRSPLVLQDLELIKCLPNPRVHFTITPYPDAVMRAIEPFSPVSASRWKVVKKLKDAGVRVHVNIAPVMPMISEQFIDDFARKLAELQVDEYFVDPMQAYKESYAAFKAACQGAPGVSWSQIEGIMCDKAKYLKWKLDYFEKWDKARLKYQHLAPNQLPIWSDHERDVWVDMRSGAQMDHKRYNGE